MGVYTTIKVTERSKGGFSRLLMDNYMIELENTTTFFDCFKSVAHAAALGSSSFSHELRPPSPKDEVQCYISTKKISHDRIRVNPTLNIKASLETHTCSFVDFEILRNEWPGDGNTQSQTSSQRNAFSVLMSNATKVSTDNFYPLKYNNPTRGDWILYNDVVTIFEKEKCYFTLKSQEVIARKVVTQITNCLFGILPHLKKLNARGYHLSNVFF